MTYAIANIIEPRTFLDYVLEMTPIKSSFFRSGIVDFNAFASQAGSDGRTVDMPFWEDWTDSAGDSNIDNTSGNDATPDTAQAQGDVAFIHSRNIALTGPDLAATVAGSDPLRVLADRAISRWDIEYQKILINSALGVMNDNDENDSDDMIYSVATDASGAPTSGQLMSADALVEGAQTMGDSKNDLVAIGMHSRVHANLQKAGALLDFYDPESGLLSYSTFVGKRVIIDDRMPVTVGDNRTTYTSVLFGAGAFAHGEGTPKVPLGVERSEIANMGGGEETLVYRRRFIIHPRGVKWTNASVAAKAPTNTELRAHANWDRVFERKNVKIAFLKTNG